MPSLPALRLTQMLITSPLVRIRWKRSPMPLNYLRWSKAPCHPPDTWFVVLPFFAIVFHPCGHRYVFAELNITSKKFFFALFVTLDLSGIPNDRDGETALLSHFLCCNDHVFKLNNVHLHVTSTWIRCVWFCVSVCVCVCVCACVCFNTNWSEVSTIHYHNSNSPKNNLRCTWDAQWDARWDHRREQDPLATY